MFNFLSKPFIIALLVSLSFNALFGYLSYSFYSDKAVAVQSLKTATEANKGLLESLDKQLTACKVSDSVVAAYVKEKQELTKETDKELDVLSKMVSVSPLEGIVVSDAVYVDTKDSYEAKEYVSLDSELPPSLRVLLSDSCERSKGSACIHP